MRQLTGRCAQVALEFIIALVTTLIFMVGMLRFINWAMRDMHDRFEAYEHTRHDMVENFYAGSRPQLN